MASEEFKILLDDVKRELKKTWEDEDLDKSITGYIKRGMMYLNKVAGTSLNFIEEDLPRQLLLDYCRYADSQALEVFSSNFQSELLELNLEYSIKRAGEGSED